MTFKFLLFYVQLQIEIVKAKYGWSRDAATRHSTCRVSMQISYNYPYFNGLYFNGFHISTASTFNNNIQCVKFSGKKEMITCYHDNMITLS
jgi:hypothetical protein